MTEHTANRATHRAFGLTWHLPIDFPPYPTVDEDVDADVLVVEEEVPRPAERAAGSGRPLGAVADGGVTIAVPGAARMHISGGRRISFQRHDDSTEENLRLMLMGPAAALLLHQRGVLPLHGSGALTEHGAVLVVGHSGMGKSTTVGALAARGYPVICDDLAAVTLDADGIARVHPGAHVMKLWADSAAALGWPTDGLPRVSPELAKFIVPLTRRTTEPIPLVAVYQLTVHDEPDVRLVQRERAAKFNVILDHTWQKMTVQQMGLHGQHFTQATRVADGVRIVTVRRPDGVPVSENGVVDAILEDLERAQDTPL